MSSNIHVPERESGTEPVWRDHYLRQPTTMLGCWSVLLATVFTIIFVVNVELLGSTGWQHGAVPFHGTTMLVCGLTGGILGGIAIVRSQERSILVWLSLLPALLAIFLILIG